MCSYRTVNVFDYEELAQTPWGITYYMEFEQHDLSKMWKILFPPKISVVNVSDKGLWLSSCLFPQPEHTPQGGRDLIFLIQYCIPRPRPETGT